MRARCSICLETLDDTTAPMATTCGHLYCADCATRHFASGVDPCAICRRGPYDFDALVRLYPDYVRTPPRSTSPSPEPSTSRSRNGACACDGRDKWTRQPALRTAGMSAIDACYDVLEDRSVLESSALETALDRTDDLVSALEDVGVPDIRTILSHVTALLGDIRKKATEERVAGDAEFAMLIARVDELQDQLED